MANAEQLVIVVAAAHPTPRTGFIDRSLVAARDAGIRPLLCITKTDLAEPAELLEYYRDEDLPILLSSSGVSAQAVTRVGPHLTLPLDEELMEQLRKALDGHISVFLGHSGVGKSTLVNALTGTARQTGGVNQVTGRGRHTSSSALAIAPDWGAPGTWVIDTPGIRSFGLAHVPPEQILAAFTDLVPGSARCHKGCTHAPGTSECGIIDWVRSGQAGPAGPQRLESLQTLLGVAPETGVHESKELGAH